MPLKITINDEEVKNPLVRFVVGVVAMGIFFIIFALALILLLPLMWVAATMFAALALTALFVAPRLIKQFRVLQYEHQKNLTRDKQDTRDD